MFRWVNVPEIDINGRQFKMLRGRFQAENIQPVEARGYEFDWHAWTYLGSELLTYRVMDVNWERFFEERGDVSRLDMIDIPVNGDIQEISV